MTFKDEKSSEISSCVCSRTIKEEFRLRNLTLKHNRAKSFVTSEVGWAFMMRKYSVLSLVFFYLIMNFIVGFKMKSIKLLCFWDHQRWKVNLIWRFIQNSYNSACILEFVNLCKIEMTMYICNLHVA